MAECTSKLLSVYLCKVYDLIDITQPFGSQEWPASNFSLQYHLWIKYYGHWNNGNDHQLKKLLIVKQILLISTTGNIWRTVWRICILIVACKGLSHLHQSKGKSRSIAPCSSAHSSTTSMMRLRTNLPPPSSFNRYLFTKPWNISQDERSYYAALN